MFYITFISGKKQLNVVTHVRTSLQTQNHPINQHTVRDVSSTKKNIRYDEPK